MFTLTFSYHKITPYFSFSVNNWYLLAVFEKTVKIQCCSMWQKNFRPNRRQKDYFCWKRGGLDVRNKVGKISHILYLRQKYSVLRKKITVFLGRKNCNSIKNRGTIKVIARVEARKNRTLSNYGHADSIRFLRFE